MNQPVATSVSQRLEYLTTALDASSAYLDPFVAARAQEDLRRLQERMSFGDEVTVAALVGGTGSGKSTMFNAITGFDFADAGELRPTTERAAACTFNACAGDLLDYLDVDSDRRIEHTSMLTVGDDCLDGLVLLDLPDHDSVRLTHAAQVTRLIPLVDLLVWVVDPQKYADQIFHQGFLAQLRDRKDVMVVVLNQIDTIPSSQRQILLDDLQRLLHTNGFDIPIIVASALSGEGIEEVRNYLRNAVQGASASAKTAASVKTANAELVTIGKRIKAYIGKCEAEVGGSEREKVVDRLMGSCGVPSVIESITGAGRSLIPTAVVEAEQPSSSMVVAIRDAWIAHVRSDLPAAWQDAVTQDIASPEKLRRAVGSALRSLERPRLERSVAWAMIVAGTLLTLTAVVLAVFVVIPNSLVAAIGTIAMAVIVWVVFYSLARRYLTRKAARQAKEYEEDVRKAIGRAVDELLVEPCREVLTRHRDAREALNDLK